MHCTEAEGKSNVPEWHLAQHRRRREEAEHVVNCNGILKGFAGVTVKAKLLCCKLPSTLAAVVKHFYFTLCDGNHQWQAIPELCFLESITLIYLNI
jgi:hypothetical protein